MGFVLPVLSAISLVASVGSKVAQGRAAEKEAEIEADSITQQADIAQAENEVEAERVQVRGNKFLARQKLAFMKGGVTLEGSPLLILEETQDEVDKEFKAAIRSGLAGKSFSRKRVSLVQRQGRGRMFGSLSSALTTGIDGVVKFVK